MKARIKSHFICTACGMQYPESVKPPRACIICTDSRQFVPSSGQKWSTLKEMRLRYRNAFEQYESGLIGIGTAPDFAIGQRALLLQTKQGNLLWDCVALIDDATIQIVRALGGLRAIAISHPHYYTTMLEWSSAFDDAPIYLHAADRHWVVRPGKAIKFWEGSQKEIAPGITLVNCGGHFPGGTVLHWSAGAGGRGVLLTGDILQVTPDGFVSFMYSYPNLIPLPAAAIGEIVEALKPFRYDRIYGAWWDREIKRQAKAIVGRSAERYLRSIDSPMR